VLEILSDDEDSEGVPWFLVPGAHAQGEACYSSAVSPSGCLETPNTGKARSPPGGRSVHGLSRRLMLATPSAPPTDDAFGVFCW